MAEEGTLKSPAEIDREAIEKYNRRMKHDLEREARLHRHFEWRGNKLPPFSIEPLQHARDRLAGQGMTPQQRALRKQWVMDQELAASEPRHIPELEPKNIIRRTLAAPWDALFKALRPLLGEHVAAYGRYFTPRISMTMLVIWAGWYNLKYHPADWTSGSQGWYMISTRPTTLPGDPDWPEGPKPEYDDFNSRGFKQRKVFHDIKTSAA